MTAPTIVKRRHLVLDGKLIGWLVKQHGWNWKAYILTRRDYQVAFWVGEGPTPEAATAVAWGLAVAHDVRYTGGAAKEPQKQTPTEE